MGMDIDLVGSTAEVTKVMQPEPRKIARIEVILNMRPVSDEKTRIILERAAITCPVFLSLHPDVEKVVTFNWK
jgi:uncharacterized OsmC-like protein